MDGAASAGRERRSYFVICLLYILHGVSYTLLIPALPLLTLKISGGDTSHSSILFGVASFTRYALEFFSAPVMGTIADVKGRKAVLVFSFLVNAAEFVILGAFPSATMILLTRALSGLGDACVATSYAVVTDIAVFNGDVVSQQYSLLAAMTGIGFVIGPYIGGMLCEFDLAIGFYTASLIGMVGATLCWFFLEETVGFRYIAKVEYQDESHITTLQYLTANPPHIAQPSSPLLHPHLPPNHSSMNPFVGLRVHLANPKLRQYVVPYFLCTLNTALSFSWYLYMVVRFHSSSSDIGKFLSFHGVMNATMLGLVAPRLIPSVLDERSATLLCLLLSAAQMFSNACSTQVYQLYINSVVYGFGAAYLPAFKSVIVNDSIANGEGSLHVANLQGAISSVRTLATAFGSLFYGLLFSWGISMHPVAYPQLGFVVAGGLFLVTWCLLRPTFLLYSQEVYVASPVESRLLAGDADERCHQSTVITHPNYGTSKDSCHTTSIAEAHSTLA